MTTRIESPRYELWVTSEKSPRAEFWLKFWHSDLAKLSEVAQHELQGRYSEQVKVVDTETGGEVLYGQESRIGRRIDMALVERTAMAMAVGNNGGSWADHYTEEQKKLWRQRAARVIGDVMDSLPEVRATVLDPAWAAEMREGM